MGLIAAGVEAHVIDRPGGIFVRRAEQIAEEDRILLQTVARAIITDRRGQRSPSRSTRRGAAEARVPRLVPTRSQRRSTPRAVARRRARSDPRSTGSAASRPTGASTSSRRAAGEATPAPWVNVLANPHFGTRDLGERASRYTWSENAHEFRLTPWHNDPVSDASGEAFYLRDEETRPLLVARRRCRAAAPAPTSRGTASATASSSTARTASLRAVRCIVAIDAPVKFAVLKVRNALGPAAPALRHRLRRMGAGRPARRRRRCT